MPASGSCGTARSRAIRSSEPRLPLPRHYLEMCTPFCIGGAVARPQGRRAIHIKCCHTTGRRGATFPSTWQSIKDRGVTIVQLKRQANRFVIAGTHQVAGKPPNWRHLARRRRFLPTVMPGWKECLAHLQVLGPHPACPVLHRQLFCLPVSKAACDIDQELVPCLVQQETIVRAPRLARQDTI